MILQEPGRHECSLEGSGFEVVDLGVDVTPEGFIKAVREGVQIIGMSALLTTTMSNMQVTVKL